jgi:GNAT superfamily N-acetyltransferase
MDEVLIREYQKDDENQIVELLKKIFPGWPRQQEKISGIDFWKWKYLDTPAEQWVIVVAESNNEIVGCHHNSFFWMKLYDEKKWGYIGGDIGVNPEFRGKGIWKKMVQKSTDITKELDLAFSIGITTNPIVKNGWEKMGEKFFPHPISLMYKIKDIGLHIRKTKLNPLKDLEYITSRILSRDSQKVEKNKFDIKEISSFEKHYDNFWAKTRGEHVFSVEKDRDYVNWRYCDDRGGNYHVETIFNGAEFLGYIVLKIVPLESGYSRGYVVDVQASKTRINVVNALLQRGLEFFDENDVNFIQALIVEGHPFEKVYRKNGFAAVKNNYSILYQEWKNDEYFKELYDTSSEGVQFQFGDLDFL